MYRWVRIISEKYFPNGTKIQTYYEALYALSGKYNLINQTEISFLLKFPMTLDDHITLLLQVAFISLILPSTRSCTVFFRKNFAVECTMS